MEEKYSITKITQEEIADFIERALNSNDFKNAIKNVKDIEDSSRICLTARIKYRLAHGLDHIRKAVSPDMRMGVHHHIIRCAMLMEKRQYPGHRPALLAACI